MQIAPINEQIQKPSNQICPLPGPKFIAEHLRQLCIHGENLNGKCTQSFRIERAKRTRSLSSINAIVFVIRCFMIPQFQSNIRTHRPYLFGNGCIHCRSFFNCMTSSCARRQAQMFVVIAIAVFLLLLFLLLLFHSIMSVNVFVWVFLSADECISNSMHLKMISKSHKWGNNSHKRRE